MKSSSAPDDIAMTPWSKFPGVVAAGLAPGATDGSWMDLETAAVYAGVPFPELQQAICRGELDPDITGGRAPMWVLHSRAVEAWAAARETAQPQLAS
jgi:hypothetical protein